MNLTPNENFNPNVYNENRNAHALNTNFLIEVKVQKAVKGIQAEKLCGWDKIPQRFLVG